MEIPTLALSEPFPHDAVKQRKGNFGQTLDYIDAPSVIARLNETLEEWSFTVLEQIIDPDEVIVKGRLQIGSSIHEQFGGSSITRKKDSGETVSIADDLKAATADCLKKCASTFGVGLYLYGGSVNGQKPKPKPNGNGKGRISSQEIAEMFNGFKDQGIPQSKVIKTATDLFKKPISQLTKLELEQLQTHFTGAECLN